MNHGDGDWRSDTERQKQEPGIETKKGRHPIMKLSPINWLLDDDRNKNLPCCWR